jgi:hypothetical protein
MSMGWDYISELRPPTGLFIIPHVIYKQGEPRWNDTDRREFLISPPEFSGKSTTSHLIAKQEELAKEIMNLAPWSIFVHSLKGSLTCRKILR